MATSDLVGRLMFGAAYQVKAVLVTIAAPLLALVWSFDTIAFQLSAEKTEATVTALEERTEVVDGETGRTVTLVDVDLSYANSEGANVIEPRTYPLSYGLQRGDRLDYRYKPGVVGSGRIFTWWNRFMPLVVVGGSVLIAVVVVQLAREANRPIGR